MVNSKILIRILLKKDLIKKDLLRKNKKYYYYNILNTKKIIKSNMKIQKINRMIIENMLEIDSDLYKKIKNLKINKIINRKHKIINNKNIMHSVQTTKPCVLNSQNKIETKMETSIKPKLNTILNNITDIKNENKFHCRSKSVTFVEDTLEQIRLFNTFDPPNSINLTPTHYSTGKINSNSLLKFHRRNRNEDFKIIPFTNTELKENTLYDHPVRRHRSNSRGNKPYNLKMDFSFGNSTAPSNLTTPTYKTASSTESLSIPSIKNSNYKTCSKEVSIISNSNISKQPKSPMLSDNFCYASSEIERPLNFVNNKQVLCNTSLLSLTENKITSIPQLV